MVANKTHKRTRGFTLVEILIVVVILGILAAVVIPQFTNASEAAKGSSLVTQLQTIRSQLELYQVQHNGDYPTLAQLQDTTNSVGQWGFMVNRTTEAGAASVAISATGTNGPYLQQAPKNPFTGFSAVVAGTSHTAGDPASDGWVYDVATNSIYAVGFDETTQVYTAPTP